MSQRPKPTAIRRIEGNRGRRGYNHAEPVPPDAQPRCPGHLPAVAQKEWRRLAHALHRMGVLTIVDRAALAAYCAAYARWVEAEEKLKATPTLYKTPSGYVQQSPWVGIANKQLELMGRFMVELGITPASRSRVNATTATSPEITFTTIYEESPSQTLLRELDTLARRIDQAAVVDAEAE